jgi:hypothetical protein
MSAADTVSWLLVMLAIVLLPSPVAFVVFAVSVLVDVLRGGTDA